MKVFPHECDIFQSLTGDENRWSGAADAAKERDVWNAASEALPFPIFVFVVHN